jgi:hypothetical protein
MRYQITQDGAGTYEIEADSTDEAISQMATDIVNSCDDWQSQFGTDNFDEAVEKAALTLSIEEG